MSPAEKIAIVSVLEASRDDFQAATAGVSESLAKTRPGENRWSVLECVEHVTTVEEIFLARLASGETTGEAPPEDVAKEAALQLRLADRSTRRQAPEAILPKGRFTSLAEGLDAFDAVRARSLQFARDHAADLYALVSSHAVLGLLNGVEAMTIIAGHSGRHAAQIREVLGTLENR